MNTITQIITSLVALLSIVLSVYTLYITQKRASRELYVRFVERIIDKRIASYPELWNITSLVYRKPGQTKEEQQSKEVADEIYMRLWDWYYVKGYGIFMNEDTRSSFVDLQYALKNYNQEQGDDKIKDKANKLRQDLRADLKLEKRDQETTDI